MKYRTDSPASACDRISPELNTGWNVSPFLVLHLKLCFVFLCQRKTMKLSTWRRLAPLHLWVFDVIRRIYAAFFVCFTYIWYVIWATKAKVKLGFRWFMLYSLACLVATVYEEAIFVPEVGLSIWQLDQEYVCTWIWAQLSLHRVKHTVLLLSCAVKYV